MIVPGNWLGVLGGGQLGRMFVHAAQRHGYRVAVLDPDADSPGGRAADLHLCAPLDDDCAVAELARRSQAVTVEREDMPERSLRAIETRRLLRPGADAVLIAQDRLREKRFLASCGVPVAPFLGISTQTDLRGADCANLLPGLLKTTRGGFDGRGQVRVETVDELPAAFDALQRRDCILERKLPLAQEFSVIAARGADGGSVVYPVFENSHERGILDWTVFPGRVPGAAGEQAREATLRVAAALNYTGVLCIEFFLLEDGRVIANEMAPRPHNSGHVTIESCTSSQFDLQLRALAGLPLSPPETGSAAVMANLLGEIWQKDEPDWTAVLKVPAARLHLYGKSTPASQRKMGHITLTGDDRDTLLASAIDLRARLNGLQICHSDS